MRQIKFRAFDIDKNEMHFDDFFVTADGQFFWNFSEELNEKMIIMQYTGLRDKYGKQIYEGDIVHFRTISGNRMTYLVYWSDAKTGFKPTRLTQNNQTEIEVVGNIYENEGLIEKMKEQDMQRQKNIITQEKTELNIIL